MEGGSGLLQIALINFRSSHPEVFCKKSVLRNIANFTGKHLCQSLVFNKVAGLGLQLYLKRDSGTGVFYRTPLVAASKLLLHYSYLTYYLCAD